MTDKAYRHERPKQRGILLTPGRLMYYSDAWALQQQLHKERLADRRPDTLLLLQHQPVYTLGRRTALSHIPGGEAALHATGAVVEMVNRGGSVTYHGPGQVVGYPILKFSRCASGPKEYVWLLEEVLRRTLTCWGIEGDRIGGKPGLFVGPRQQTAKIASIGVRIDRGITLHGFALNVDLDLTPFSFIVPCGLTGGRTTSMAAFRKSSVPLQLVLQQVAEQFAQLFNLSWDETPMQVSDEWERPHTALSGIEDPVKVQIADA